MAFATPNNLPVSLGTPRNDFVHNGIRHCGNRYKLDRAIEEYQIVWRISAGPPDTNYPQATKRILTRLRHKAYRMNRAVDHLQEDRFLSAKGGEEFVEWNLREGEVVVFKFGSFIGMSSSIKLRTVFNFKLSSLMLGQLFYSAAEGPGRLIFQTNGQPLNQQEARASFDKSQLVAWHIDSAFSVDSKLSFWNLYIDDVNIKKQPNDPAIVDVSPKKHPSFGLLKYVFLHV